ncbi:Hsp33 family molecular chaperone HslO [Cohnella thailandensis]|uniref:33 kDa chaperonin n=1 Tax=Cohnella thailandensis TaxID=557557 RepID=A0A841T502_9BACL|nr:Hsp33 family molecular chaperone HslO [Cohnella thailandensis]MBB6637926.1 Hsp33 family molecular chaperone HslO [Cohnella thailandensis]MBP1977736.1 molecular chaperone Hsp33 [Cohnella thailandensis]
MELKDELVRGTAWNGAIRVFAARTTALVGEMQRRHDTYPTATAALGRTATAAAMMGAMLKGEEKLTVQVKGDGPIGQIVVDATASGQVRGYADFPHVHLPSNPQGKLDVAGAVGHTGYLHVTKDLGLKEPYRGSIPLISGELAEDFTYYFASSEQTPSAVGLGVLVDTDNSVLHAGGFIVQVMPGIEEEQLVRLEKAIAGMPHVTALLDQGEDAVGILKFLVGDDLTIHETIEPVFECFCSRERVERTLVSLGREELRKLIDEDGHAEVKCHFCNEDYRFEASELEEILKKATL